MNRIPINDDIVLSISRLVDDSQSNRRDPSHSDIGFQIQRVGLSELDPSQPGNKPVGKEKRVRHFLYAAMEKDMDKAELFGFNLIASIRSSGGFREGSQNYVGKENINNLKTILNKQGISLGIDGSITTVTLENLSGKALTEALQTYVIRAKRGNEDAALLVGTGKDLMEAVCAHVITEIYGSYNYQQNFPTLLAQAFNALKLSISSSNKDTAEHPRASLERNLFELACSINRLRNKQGTGHGRPWLVDLGTEEARLAIESIGVIAEFLLAKLNSLQN